MDVFPQQASNEPEAKVGDLVTDGGTAANPFRKELDNPDDGDKKMGKGRKLGRAVVRNASDVKSQAQETFSASVADADDFEPTATVEVPRREDPIVTSNTADVQTQDAVGNAVLMAAFAVEGISRLGRKWRSRA